MKVRTCVAFHRRPFDDKGRGELTVSCPIGFEDVEGELTLVDPETLEELDTVGFDCDAQLIGVRFELSRRDRRRIMRERVVTVTATVRVGDAARRSAGASALIELRVRRRDAR